MGEFTAPPCSLKNSGISVPPPKNDILNGVFVIIIIVWIYGYRLAKNDYRNSVIKLFRLNSSIFSLCRVVLRPQNLKKIL